MITRHLGKNGKILDKRAVPIIKGMAKYGILGRKATSIRKAKKYAKKWMYYENRIINLINQLTNETHCLQRKIEEIEAIKAQKFSEIQLVGKCPNCGSETVLEGSTEFCECSQCNQTFRTEGNTFKNKISNN